MSVLRSEPIRTAIKSDRPDGWQAFARELVEEAESLLWSGHGGRARSYLARFGLTEETIREARLGYQPHDRRVPEVFPGEALWVPRGIVIPWLDGRDIEAVNVRRPVGQPKFVAIKGSRRGGVYPGRSGIVTGKPLVIAHEEFEALLLGQELGGAVPVVTIGRAGGWPIPRVLSTMLRAFPWIIASDADDVAERSDEDWLSLSDRCARMLPPGRSGKNWSEAYQDGLDLRGCFLSALEKVASAPAPPTGSSKPETDPFWGTFDEEPEETMILGSISPDVDPNRWRCLNPYCLNKGRWWMSEHGVVLCTNCQPPGSPSLAIARGDASHAPFVEPDRSRQAVGYARPVSPSDLIRSGSDPSDPLRPQADIDTESLPES